MSLFRFDAEVGDYVWATSGETVSYVANALPPAPDTSEECVTYFNAYWYTTWCTEFYQAICEVDLN